MNTNLSRRSFLGAAGTLGVLGASRALFPTWMPRLAFRDQLQVDTPGDALICIFLRGGMDGLSAVAPYAEGAAYYDARPTQSIAEPGSGVNTLVDLDGQFGLHPSLAMLKELYDEGDLAVVHATGSPDPTRSHFEAMTYMELGTPGEKKIGTGWIGRHLETAAWQNNSPFRAVGMGAMVPQSMRGPVTPLAIQSIIDFHFKGREDEIRKLQHSLASLYTVAYTDPALSRAADIVFDTIETLQSLDAANYVPAGGALYPDDYFGMGLQQVSLLIKAQVGLEVACVDLGGWDTHENQGTLDGEFNYLLSQLGQGLLALYTDLGKHTHNVTVVVMSEFGRTLQENGSAGTDHGHGNVMLLMGGGIQGGQVYSRWPSLRPEMLADGDLAITTDYRDVLAEVLGQRMLNGNVANVFPDHTISPLGLVIPRE